MGGAERAIIQLVHHLKLLGHEAAVGTISVKPENMPTIAAQLDYIIPEKPLQEPRRLDNLAVAVRSIIDEIATLSTLIQDCYDDFDVLSPCNFPAYWSTYARKKDKPIVWICSEVFGPYVAS